MSQCVSPADYVVQMPRRLIRQPRPTSYTARLGLQKEGCDLQESRIATSVRAKRLELIRPSLRERIIDRDFEDVRVQVQPRRSYRE